MSSTLTPTPAMYDGSAEVVRLVRQFASADQVHTLRACIQRKAELFVTVDGSLGFAPRYRVIHGHAVRNEIPELVAFGERHIRPLAEAFAGRSLAPLGESPHDIRIQHFTDASHNFRWHFDGHTYNALLTLVNGNASETQVVTPALSRVVKRVYLPLALTPRVFSVLPHQKFAADAGDVMLLRGEGLLHRGVVGRSGDGERLIVVFCFNEVGKAPRRMSWIRQRVLRAINFGYSRSK